MKTSLKNSISKIRILILIMMAGNTACNRQSEVAPGSLIRFEKLVFTIPPGELPDSIHRYYPELETFFRIFNEEVIRIGPDSLPGYAEQLQKFTGDSLMRQIYASTDKSAALIREKCLKINQALDRWAAFEGNTRPDHIVTYLSGFNQSFITLPGCLGIGIDNFLGSESPFYKGLGIPVYIRENMKPDNLAADAVRAWLYSELPEPPPEGNFLDRMIYEGKIHYIAQKIMSGESDENLFHYSKEQLEWCKAQEKAMWKYLAEQKILFSTNRLTIRKFLDEAPFTRDFGNDSPGRTGIWIGCQIVKKYMKTTGTDLNGLISMNNAQEILSASKYHP